MSKGNYLYPLLLFVLFSVRKNGSKHIWFFEYRQHQACVLLNTSEG